ncbi:VRR-NUC domain-containing protein [Ottowia thiooxydans]|uniref:VRR-NUC domain-containing protein n=1 Tax=Ottowia thiooxydans TaxID=219182 RepID=UPI0004006F36|nr:VRR-NUC domain-containing protein [Ottowia thiooxydans]
MSEPTLSPHRFYYLHNFQQALSWIGERYEDLLDEREQQFLSQFSELSQASQALMVRLLMRRGPWFLAEKLRYEEIPEISRAAEPLLALGWLDAGCGMGLDELFALHTKPELRRIFAEIPVRADIRKPELFKILLALHEAPRTYADWNPQTGDAAWRVTVGELCERFRLMFFGNLHQDWSEFVLADLGVFRYEAVVFDKTSRAFQSRSDVDHYLFLHECREALEKREELDVLLQAVSARTSDNPWIEKRRAKLLLRMGQSCERAEDWGRAEQAYAQCSYPGARHRRMRVYERMGRFSEAMALALESQAKPESDEESQRVARMVPRLQRKLGQGVNTRPANPQATVAQLRTDIELDLPDEPTSVEYVLRAHWHSDEAPAFYVENALINSLFGLLCWPAVFAPLPGAFFHPFQSGPSDFGAPDFVQRRLTLFGACLAHLEDGSYREVIRQRFEDKHGVQSPFVFWGTLSEELLSLALDCIPTAHLKLFFTRLMLDVQANRSGFPDLVRFWPSERRYELVEVKAPGDRLQDNQIRWLQYCAGHGLPVRVCHVHWRVESEGAP